MCMALDNVAFSEHFKKNDYDYCVQALRKELINFLVNKIKEKKPDYKYSTISVLKNDCLKYLKPAEQDIAIFLYTISFNNDTSEFKLSRMMEMYQYFTN